MLNTETIIYSVIGIGIALLIIFIMRAHKHYETKKRLNETRDKMMNMVKLYAQHQRKMMVNTALLMTTSNTYRDLAVLNAVFSNRETYEKYCSRVKDELAE